MARKSEVKLKAPYVAPGVDPRAAAYAKDIAARRYTEPVAGGPTPPVPRLDQEPLEGTTGTMSDYARAQRSIVEPAKMEPAAYILPGDALPQEAQADPAFQHGQGSMYAAAQPMLARKYGVMRNGVRIPPQQLYAPPGEPPKPGRLSKQTIDAIKAVKKAQMETEQAEQGSQDSPAGVAANIGSGTHNQSPPAERPPTNEEVRDRLAKMDEFDLDQLHTMMVRDILNNEEQRKIVEDRLSALDLADLVMQGHVTQKVPIVPGVFEPTYQSLAGEDDLACKRLIVHEAANLKVDDRYLLDKYAFMGLTCALYAIGGKPLPSHKNEKGDFDEAKFWEKFRMVLKFPLPMLASLGVHYFYFDVRVRRLFVAEKVKNG